MEEILKLLRKDARLSNAEIARRLGRTEEEVAERMAQLEKEKVILGTHAILNPDKIKDAGLIGIIEVKLTPERESGFDAIAQRIYNFPEVRLCYLISGSYDLLVFVEGETLQDVAMFVAQKLAPIAHVNSTATHFILKKYKEDGIILSDPQSSERLPISF